jgi:uncharacterized protein
MTTSTGRFATTAIGPSLFAVFDKTTRFTALCESPSSGEIDFAELAAGNEACSAEASTFDTRVPLSTWVLNVTEECNLRCRYCSRHHADYAGRPMPSSVMLRALQTAASIGAGQSESVTVQFHGGEPLIHFDRIVASIERLSKEEYAALDFRIQTNGSLLTQSILDRCDQHNIHVGLSLDGPPEINGIHRRYRGGQPLGDELVEKLYLLRTRLKRHRVSCLCVMSSANIDKADSVFDYILAHAIDDLSILPLYPDYANCLTGCQDLIPRAQEMVAFSTRIFDRWIERLRLGHDICMPSFQIWIWNLLHGNSNSLLSNSCCGVGESMVFVDTDGSTYPCGPFSYSTGMRLGTVMTAAPTEFMSSTTALDFLQRTTARVEGCDLCGLQAVCRGGCPANSYLKSGSVFEKDPFCEYWHGIISHVLRRIAEEPSICDLVPSYTIRL